MYENNLYLKAHIFQFKTNYFLLKIYASDLVWRRFPKSLVNISLATWCCTWKKGVYLHCLGCEGMTDVLVDIHGGGPDLENYYFGTKYRMLQSHGRQWDEGLTRFYASSIFSLPAYKNQILRRDEMVKVL